MITLPHSINRRPMESLVRLDFFSILASILLGLGLSVLISYMFSYLHIDNDFSSFYQSANSYFQNQDLYPNKLIPNLNPPLFIFFTLPLAKLPYSLALFIWLVVSTLSLLFGGLIALKHSPTRSKLCLFLLFCCYPSLLNFRYGQIASIIFFLIMIGFDQYKKNNINTALFLWGFSAALKLFPLLLIFYIIKFNQLKYGFKLIVIFFLFSFFPIIFFGASAYYKYLSLINSIFWLGNNWNCSVIGFVFRIFICENPVLSDVYQAKVIAYFLGCFLLITFGYNFLNRTKFTDKDKAFALCILVMLLINPLTWIYYLLLLFYPILLLYDQIKRSKLFTKGVFFIALSFLFIPQKLVPNPFLTNFLLKFTIYSFPFYGLILLFYLCYTHKPISLIKKNSKPLLVESITTSVIVYIIIASGVFRFIVDLGQLMLPHLNLGT